MNVYLIMAWQDFIGSDPKVLNGKPVLLGTRISVELIVELLGQGWSREQILEAYPHLREEQITATFDFLKHHLASEIILPLPKAS